MTIFVGSTNPVKINAVTMAASETWPEVVIKGFEVPSGIPEQPIGDDQTREGAENRSRNVLERGLAETAEVKKQTPDNSQFLGVGLEGGVFEYRGELWSTVWVVVTDPEGFTTQANGARFKVPESVAQKIQDGGEMGPIISQIVKEADVRKKQGMIGVITEGFVDRTEEYSGIAKMALGLWYGRNWAKKVPKL